VDGTGLGSCAVASFCIPSGSATRQLINKMDFREIGCGDGRWMELAQDRVEWQAFVLAVLKFLVLLQES